MLEKILVFETEKEAEQQLEKYDKHNIKKEEEFNEEYGKCERHIQRSWRQQEDSKLNEINRQKRYFVTELIAYPDEYLFSASSFPFVGENEFCKDISSLVEGVKNTIKRLNGTYPTIEAVFYTVKNHDERNQEVENAVKEAKEEIEETFVKDQDTTEDEFNEMKEKFLLGFLKEEGIDETRGLNQQEREEFERLFSGENGK